jgi:hypothetical protein
MDCDLEQREDGLWHCKAGCGREPYPKKIRQACGVVPLCDCGHPLKRRQKEKRWWWWCKQCDLFVRECPQCNAAIDRS